jgi:hypothetical protein
MHSIHIVVITNQPVAMAIQARRLPSCHGRSSRNGYSNKTTYPPGAANVIYGSADRRRPPRPSELTRPMPLLVLTPEAAENWQCPLPRAVPAAAAKVDECRCAVHFPGFHAAALLSLPQPRPCLVGPNWGRPNHWVSL